MEQQRRAGAAKHVVRADGRPREKGGDMDEGRGGSRHDFHRGSLAPSGPRAASLAEADEFESDRTTCRAKTGQETAAQR